jgi:hypothetical protein
MSNATKEYWKDYGKSKEDGDGPPGRKQSIDYFDSDGVHETSR